jgi:hypothetical protein
MKNIRAWNLWIECDPELTPLIANFSASFTTGWAIEREAN